MADIKEEVSGQIFIHVAEPSSVTAVFSDKTDKEGLSGNLTYALYHRLRTPDWVEVTHVDKRWYVCQLVTLPFLYFTEHRVATPRAKALFDAAMKHITLTSGSTDPDLWLGVDADWFCPLPRPAANGKIARRVSASLMKAALIRADPEPVTAQGSEPEEADAPEPEDITSSDAAAGTAPGENRDTPVRTKKRYWQPAPQRGEPGSRGQGRRSGISEERVMQRFYEGMSVPDICRDQDCSEAYVYKLIKRKKGLSATDFRWHRWKMIADMYLAVPRKTLTEIEDTLNVSRAQIYHAVKKVCEKENIPLPQERRDRKLSAQDIEDIRDKLAAGALRKNICRKYSITESTLVKYFGTAESYRVIPESTKEDVVRLRMQGKTLADTAKILDISVGVVKKVWREHRDNPDVKRRRVKVDNRNPLSKRDRELAVKAVLEEGHTRTQTYKQFGINALTLRRYIRAAQKDEVETLRTEKEKKPATKKKGPGTTKKD